MVDKRLLKPWVLKQISPIVDLTVDEAKQQGVKISSMRITEELHNKILSWVTRSVMTYARYGEGGKYSDANRYKYTCYFTLSSTSSGNYYIYRGGSEAWAGGRLEELKKKTLDMEQMFYGILRKYPEHLLNVEWNNPALQNKGRSRKLTNL